jgi:hypothetical protein
MENSTVESVVTTLREQINTALQGENAAKDIEAAIYKMLDTLNIPVSKK